MSEGRATQEQLPRWPLRGPPEAIEAARAPAGRRHQAQMVLVTFAETKVTRVRGRRPGNTPSHQRLIKRPWDYVTLRNALSHLPPKPE